MKALLQADATDDQAEISFFRLVDTLHLPLERASTSMSDDDKEVIVIGHRNPDTDAITAALVYADFLRRMKVKAKAYRLGDLNNETKFVLKSADVQEPDMLPDDVPEESLVALVDHNECEQ